MESLICLAPPCIDGAIGALDLVRFAMAAFLGILFLQSGVDKVVAHKGNLQWLTGHFSKSPLAGLVAPMLAVITVVELAAGALSAYGAVVLLVTGSRLSAALGALSSMAAVLMLFFGQRMAKDYAGAAGLVPYFILASGALALLGLP